MAGQPVHIAVPEPHLWSPDDPFLYDLTVTLVRDGREIDRAASYAALREIATVRDAGGIERMTLNGRPLFHFGPLDQGWWPDGLYTAPTDEALLYDIRFTKQLGFNMIRKHIKVEPERWYWHCDREGVLRLAGYAQRRHVDGQVGAAPLRRGHGRCADGGVVRQLL